MTRTKKLILSVIAAISLTLFVLNSISPLSTKAADWQLEVVGLVDHPLSLNLSELAAMPATSVEATIYCVDFPSRIVETGSWTGVKLGYLLEAAGVSPSATKLAFFASDGYSTDLLLETATQPDIIVAYEKDGTTLGALRLVVPGRWGYKWISQLTKIEVVNYDFKGRWESQGYSDDGLGPGVGKPDLPYKTDFPDRPTIEQNTTSVSPTSPNPSNPSNTTSSQETGNSIPDTTSPENPGSLPIAPIVIIVVICIVLVGVAAMVYRRKHIHYEI